MEAAVNGARGWPALRIRELLTESLGDPVDADLFGGFLAAFGGALHRGGPALVSDPPEYGALLVAEFAGRPPMAIPVDPGVEPAGLDADLSAVLAACARRHREAGERVPCTHDLLADLVHAARERIVDPDGRALTLLEIFVQPPPPASGPPDPAGPDWRDQAALLIAVGRAGLPGLAPLAADVEIPPAAAGLCDQDRRVLLALRDVAVARARGVAFTLPAHPDPGVARARARLLADIEAVLDGTRLPDPDSPAYLLRAVVDPGADGRMRRRR